MKFFNISFSLKVIIPLFIAAVILIVLVLVFKSYVLFFPLGVFFSVVVLRILFMKFLWPPNINKNPLNQENKDCFFDQLFLDCGAYKQFKDNLRETFILRPIEEKNQFLKDLINILEKNCKEG